MAAAETVGNQELIKRFWGFPVSGPGIPGSLAKAGQGAGKRLQHPLPFPHAFAHASSGVGEAADPSSKKSLGAGLLT